MSFTFIDLFSGIGGFHLALSTLGGKCVFSSEIDRHACEMYQTNFGIDPYCDITKIDASVIPDFDILCAGFPCQPFSISGLKRGFEDTRGTLFFDIARILQTKKPKAFILENVKNLALHDHGNTLHIILETLNALNYTVSYQILNAKDFGLPQNRERIFIVGSGMGQSLDFSKITQTPVNSMKPFLDTAGDFNILHPSEYTILKPEEIKRNEKSGLIFAGYRNKNFRTNGVLPNTQHLSRTHKQCNRIYSAEGTCPTIMAGETSGRYWIYIGEIVRQLTLNECFRFFGFPESFKKTGAKGQLYKRIGNSVCIPVVEEITRELLKTF